MTTAAETLARFTAGLAFDSLPANVVARARDCMTDTVAAAILGTRFDWSQPVVDYAKRYGSGGSCTLLGIPGSRVHAPYAALANGALAHAFEIDSVGTPPHPGSSLLPAVLAAAEETGSDGKTAITAFVAGCEVLGRLSVASHHSTEKLGFHAPGVMGPYGAAAAAGRVFGLDAAQMENALGIAGSLSSGLLAFTKSKRGTVVKRLHLGRAAESGILAARLASCGYEGPEGVLEGKFGFLEAYCRDSQPAKLIEGLGEKWQTLQVSLKRYACHVYAQIPVQSLRELMAEHAFSGTDVSELVIEGAEKLLTHHNIPEPADIKQAQYSVPFCVALALFRDPDDPRSFDSGALNDASIRSACRKVQLRVQPLDHVTPWAARVKVRLKDGRELSRGSGSYKGMPEKPFSQAELRRKFMALAGETPGIDAAALFERLQAMETQPSLRAIF